MSIPPKKIYRGALETGLEISLSDAKAAPSTATAVAINGVIKQFRTMSGDVGGSENHYIGLAEFRRSLRRFLAYSEVITKAHGVTSQQYQVLLAIKTLPPQSTTVADVARELLLKHNSAVELTKRMEKSGFVSRLRNVENRRKVDLALTAKGLKTLEVLAELHRAELLAQRDRIRRAIGYL